MATRIERREFVKRAAYAAPLILSLKAMPAFAASGSAKSKRLKENTQAIPENPAAPGSATQQQQYQQKSSSDPRSSDRRRH